MIQKFKKKTILTLTIILWGILAGILLVINVSNYHSNQAEVKNLLITQLRILESGEAEDFAKPIDRERNIIPIYSVMLDEEGKYQVVYSTDGSDYNDEKLIQTAKYILNEDKKAGVFNHYRYRISAIDGGRIISFLDYSVWEHQQYQMIGYSILIALTGMIILLFIAFLLAGWLIKPVITAFDKQKQFISDAGHELKTPLTVVKASLDMLESEYGKNKYFEYIREENGRMTDLVYGMLSLSSLESSEEKPCLEKVDLSRIVEGTCLPFECLAFESGIHLKLEIQEDIQILGIEKQIKQLVEVLLDNGIKHTYNNGEVIVRLRKDRGKALLQVENEGETIPEEERRKIFDRFYRGDRSRNRKEGRYGLGLSIARTIAEAHKARIFVECRDGRTVFCVNFSRL